MAAKLSGDDVSEVADARDGNRIREFLQPLYPFGDTVVIDITGLSRMAMMSLLAAVYERGLRPILIYTEARTYYPTKEQFSQLSKRRGSGEPFVTLNEFENGQIMYSSHCELEQVDGLEGVMLPNYPLMLITFLTFKRGRVSLVLQSFEASVRVLIKGVPVREDLAWRADAIELPNCDLIEGSRLVKLETLDWRMTYNFLCELYNDEDNKYRFNFVLAPLGSKMQTVGAWLFARRQKQVRVISSTPRTLFHEKYSRGCGETFLFDDLPSPPEIS